MEKKNTCPLCRVLIQQKFFVKFYVKRKYITGYKKVGTVMIFNLDYILLKYFGNDQIIIRYMNITRAEYIDKKIKIYLHHPMKKQYIITIKFETHNDKSFAFECIRYYVNKYTIRL